MINIVDSNSQQERILARRERIQQRIDIKNEQKKKIGSNLNERKDLTAATTNTTTTTTNNSLSSSSKIEENSAKEVSEKNLKALNEYINQGQSILSDVKIASMNHESNRRNEQEKQQNEMIERLNFEAKIENKKFTEISEKWKIENSGLKISENGQINPSDLYLLLNDQNEKCKNVISEKNKIINLLKEVARTAEDRYVKDLKRENDDIELISKRMETHIKDMSIKFQNSLNKIQESLLNDRENTNKNANEKSKNSWKARSLREIEMVYLRLNETDKFTQDLDEIRERGSEEYSIMRNKLESDVMTHEQQLQQMKAIYQLNQEKLQYNHEILRNREDENNIIKAQQKRRITKLQDNLNIQRQKLVKQEQQHKNESINLSDDYDRIVQLTKELETKMKHFENSDSKRFHEVWKMNFNTVKQLAAECLCADRIIHLQQLGINWDKEIDKVWFVSQDEMNDGRLDISNGNNGNSSNSGHTVFTNDPVLAPWQAENVKKIVEIIPSKENLEDSSNIISNSNSSSITITNNNELIEVVSKKSHLSQQTVRNLLPLLAEEGDFLFEKKLATLLENLESSHSTLIKLDSIFSALNIQAEEDITILVEHLRENLGSDMDINKVVPALKNYVLKLANTYSSNYSNSSDSTKISNRNNPKINSSLIGNEWAALDNKYWKEMQNVIDTRKIHLWDALDDGLSKYSNQLMERRNLISQTDNLKNQNNELRMLLQKYLCSKVNQKLKIPPTKVLQSEAMQR